MKQVLHIFFLGLSILFSFGVTSFQSGCSAKVEDIESNTACCKVNTEQGESNEHTKGDCCSTDACQGSCCFESVDFFHFNDFIVEGNSINFNDVEISLIPSLQSFLLSLDNSNVNSLKENISIPPDALIYKSIAKHIIIEHQSWLI